MIAFPHPDTLRTAIQRQLDLLSHAITHSYIMQYYTLHITHILWAYVAHMHAKRSKVLAAIWRQKGAEK